MDVFSVQKRSEIMCRIRSKNTAPEILVRKLAHGLGFRFRLHAADLPGKPDLVFRSRAKVIFVHGCFWHGHRGCKRAKVPATRRKFWTGKIAANRKRDGKALRALTGSGWQSLVVWQCELNDRHRVADRLRRFLATP